MRRWMVLFGIAALAGCQPPLPPPIADGMLHIRQSGTFQCTGQPVSLDGSHTDTTLEGACSRVVIRGSHNDVTVYVVPAAVLDVTGSSNDIVWRLVRRGPRPTLLNEGVTNTYYRNSRAPWEQDHDWWQEQH